MQRDKPPRRYSDEERAAALTVLDFCDGNVQEAARRLGMPWTTLDNWAKGRVNAGVSKVREHKNAELASRFEQIVLRALQLLPEKLESAPVNQLITAAGIAVDKMLLLRNQPTQITELQMTETEATERIGALIAEARRRQGKQEASPVN
jgi:transposase-like protein